MQQDQQAASSLSSRAGGARSQGPGQISRAGLWLGALSGASAPFPQVPLVYTCPSGSGATPPSLSKHVRPGQTPSLDTCPPLVLSQATPHGERERQRACSSGVPPALRGGVGVTAWLVWGSRGGSEDEGLLAGGGCFREGPLLTLGPPLSCSPPRAEAERRPAGPGLQHAGALPLCHRLLLPAGRGLFPEEEGGPGLLPAPTRAMSDAGQVLQG